jgi:long-chain acyl-CoA synthetase
MKDYPWLNSYPEGVEWDHMIDPKPVYRILNDAVSKFPENIALEFMGKKITYNCLKSLVNRAEKGLVKLGVKKGDRVGILMPNCPQYIISYFAILRAGATVVQLSPLLSDEELSHQIKDSGAETIITLDLKLCYGKLVTIAGDADIKNIVVGSLADYLPKIKGLAFSLFKRGNIAQVVKSERNISWRKLLDQHGDDEFEAIVVNPEKDVAVLQYTGGTTGTPKGAMLTHANIYSNTLQTAMWCQHELDEGEERMLAVLPFFHIFAMTVVMNFALQIGATIIIHPRFDLKKTLKDISKKKPTIMPGVPTMYNAINTYKDLKKYDLTSLKLCVSGGAPLVWEIKSKFEEKTGCKLVEGYGLTESSPIACVNPIGQGGREGSIGLPLTQTTVTIEDIDKPGTRVPIGEKGELCIRGPQVMKGYWNKPQETDEVLNNGKLRTGDIARMDGDGFVYVVDRLKELIITGGFNVYPRNVEEALYKHPAVKEAAVVGVDDVSKGQLVKAFVAFNEGELETEENLIKFLKDKLAKYEVPALVEIIDELPKTMIGKISKKDLVNKQ